MARSVKASECAPRPLEVGDVVDIAPSYTDRMGYDPGPYLIHELNVGAKGNINLRHLDGRELHFNYGLHVAIPGSEIIRDDFMTAVRRSKHGQP